MNRNLKIVFTIASIAGFITIAYFSNFLTSDYAKGSLTSVPVKPHPDYPANPAFPMPTTDYICRAQYTVEESPPFANVYACIYKGDVKPGGVWKVCYTFIADERKNFYDYLKMVCNKIDVIP